MESQTENEVKLMTVLEAADTLKVHRNTIYNLCRENLLPYIRVGQQYRIITNSSFLSLKRAYEIQKNAQN